METFAVLSAEENIELINLLHGEYEVNRFRSYHDLLEDEREKVYDFLYFDLDLLKRDGVNIPSAIKKHSSDSRVIIATRDASLFPRESVNHEYAKLTIPDEEEVIKRVADHILRVKQVRHERCIKVPEGQYEIEIHYDNIYAITVSEHKITIHTPGWSQEFRESLSHVMKQLPEDQFLLCDRETLVNMKHIHHYETGKFIMDNGDTYEVKERGRSVVTAKYKNFVTAHCQI